MSLRNKILWLGFFLAAVWTSVLPATAQDPYQDWLSFEAPFEGGRPLPIEETLWIAQLATNADVIEIEPKTVSSTWFPDVFSQTELPIFSPSQNTQVDREFFAPRDRLTYLKSDNPIRIEISGQSIALPGIEGFHDANRFADVLQYWLGRDLTELVTLVKRAQQETGWSDYELVRLMRLYSLTMNDLSDSTALQTSFWLQAGYRVQLARSDDEWILLLALNRAPGAQPLYEHDGSWWLPTTSVESRLTFVATEADMDGQALRLTSVNDRSRTSTFTRHEFWFENENALLSVRWEIPTHWAQVRWHGKDEVSLLAEPLPGYVLQQLDSLMGEEDDISKLEMLAGWLRDEFENAGTTLSLQQALYFQQMTSQNRFQVLTNWWKQMVRGSVALVRTPNETLLALELPENLSDERTFEHRKRRWLLLNPAMNLLAPNQIEGNLDWLFIP